MEARLPELPRMVGVRQPTVGPVVADVAAEVESGLSALDLGARVRPGQSVGITAGSRGISGALDALKAIVAHVSGLGARPFVVPAMGSHGGATAEGQLGVLRAYGIDERSIGCPIRSSMEVVELGHSPGGLTMWQDGLAAAADHMIVCNRVKPHTMFAGSVESGLAKMLIIGLGKERGASLIHRAIMDRGWEAVVADLLPAFLDRSSVLGGVALVERADERTAVVSVLAPERWAVEEPALLAEARRLMARLPYKDLDLLMLDEIGKNISGAGLDTNVVGRKERVHPATFRPGAMVRLIAVRALSAQTGGNGVGVGLAEFARTRILRQMDTEVTRINALTAGDLPTAMIPIHYETDGEILAAALSLTGLRPPAKARVVWARNTLELERTLCSEVLVSEGPGEGLEIEGDPFDLHLDADGNLPDDLSDLWNQG
jgi:hypothetical protein